MYVCSSSFGFIFFLEFLCEKVKRLGLKKKIPNASTDPLKYEIKCTNSPKMHNVDYKDDTDKDRYSSNGYKKLYTNIA